MATVIEFVEEIDNSPGGRYNYNDYMEYPQGTTWINYRIYRLGDEVDEDGDNTYIRIGVEYGSYGGVTRWLDPELVTPQQKIVTVWA